jgi:NADH:ubiquinone oxidoreductase subunit E
LKKVERFFFSFFDKKKGAVSLQLCNCTCHMNKSNSIGEESSMSSAVEMSSTRTSVPAVLRIA